MNGAGPSGCDSGKELASAGRVSGSGLVLADAGTSLAATAVSPYSKEPSKSHFEG